MTLDGFCEKCIFGSKVENETNRHSYRWIYFSEKSVHHEWIQTFEFHRPLPQRNLPSPYIFQSGNEASKFRWIVYHDIGRYENFKRNKF